MLRSLGLASFIGMVLRDLTWRVGRFLTYALSRDVQHGWARFPGDTPPCSLRCARTIRRKDKFFRLGTNDGNDTVFTNNDACTWCPTWGRWAFVLAVLLYFPSLGLPVGLPAGTGGRAPCRSVNSLGDPVIPHFCASHFGYRCGNSVMLEKTDSVRGCDDQA